MIDEWGKRGTSRHAVSPRDILPTPEPRLTLTELARRWGLDVDAALLIAARIPVARRHDWACWCGPDDSSFKVVGGRYDGVYPTAEVEKFERCLLHQDERSRLNKVMKRRLKEMRA